MNDQPRPGGLGDAAAASDADLPGVAAAGVAHLQTAGVAAGDLATRTVDPDCARIRQHGHATGVVAANLPAAAHGEGLQRACTACGVGNRAVRAFGLQGERALGLVRGRAEADRGAVPVDQDRLCGHGQVSGGGLFDAALPVDIDERRCLRLSAGAGAHVKLARVVAGDLAAVDIHRAETGVDGGVAGLACQHLGLVGNGQGMAPGGICANGVQAQRAGGLRTHRDQAPLSVNQDVAATQGEVAACSFCKAAAIGDAEQSGVGRGAVGFADLQVSSVAAGYLATCAVDGNRPPVCQHSHVRAIAAFDPAAVADGHGYGDGVGD